MKSLKYIRILLASLMLLGITALLLDGIAWMLDDPNLLRHCLGWMPKMQLLPAMLALNVVVVAAVLLVTFLVGRLYCSVVCPMGVFQDIFIGFYKGLFGKKYPYGYRKPQNWMRYTMLGLFVLLMVLGLGGIASLVAPYGAYARIVTNIYGTGAVHWVALATLCCVTVMSFLCGRLWCNTFCPVGSLLGLISRHSLFGIRIDSGKCVGCHRCEHRCKAMCINLEDKSVDGSRCVMCFDCLGQCKQKAITIGRRRNVDAMERAVDPSRRRFLAVTAALGTAAALKAQEQKLDGGLAAIENKTVPVRTMPLRPAGAVSLSNFKHRCIACQLCVSKCPEHVLRPSSSLENFMQPYMAFDQGYCRIACTRCGEVCPTGAIQPIEKSQKTAISVGHAIVIRENCIGCGACERHCPSGAVFMVDGAPSVNENRCVGCGACEYYCPARPMTAIYVEGRDPHNEL